MKKSELYLQGKISLADYINELTKEDVMKTGDYIYYHDINGDTFPGRILQIKKRVKIRINYDESGDKIIWVSRSNIELQD